MPGPVHRAGHDVQDDRPAVSAADGLGCALIGGEVDVDAPAGVDSPLRIGATARSAVPW